jgi:hypothetical protein
VFGSGIVPSEVVWACLLVPGAYVMQAILFVIPIKTSDEGTIVAVMVMAFVFWCCAVIGIQALLRHFKGATQKWQV